MTDRLVSKRRKEMAAWSAKNLHRWPTFVGEELVDPAEILCRFVPLDNGRNLPVLECQMGGGRITSSDWFYAKKKQQK